jgi:hypothetical protein
MYHSLAHQPDHSKETKIECGYSFTMKLLSPILRKLAIEQLILYEDANAAQLKLNAWWCAWPNILRTIKIKAGEKGAHRCTKRESKESVGCAQRSFALLSTSGGNKRRARSRLDIIAGSRGEKRKNTLDRRWTKFTVPKMSSTQFAPACYFHRIPRSYFIRVC